MIFELLKNITSIMQCLAITVKNKPCKLKRVGDSDFCRYHISAFKNNIHTCPICMESYYKVKKFDCNHITCKDCYKRVKRCPICRYPKFYKLPSSLSIYTYDNVVIDDMLITVLIDYLAGFSSKNDIKNIITQMFEQQNRPDYARSLYLLLVNENNDEKVLQTIVNILFSHIDNIYRLIS